jgi:magnesium chelatase family protein
VEVGALAADELINTPPGESTDAIRARVVKARERAIARQGSTNQALDGQAIDEQCKLDEAAAKFLNTAAARLGWSGRSIHRCLKVARTIADLVGARTVQVTHVAEAVQYRRALKSAH